MSQSFGSSFNRNSALSILNSNAEYKEYSKNISVWNMDMARDYHFKVSLTSNVNKKMNHGLYGEFIPVKSINYKPPGVEYEDLDVGGFNSLPLLCKMTCGEISMELYDTDDSSYERDLELWYAFCRPYNGYVPYMKECIADLRYSAFDNTGSNTHNIYFPVIPKGEYEVSMDTSRNELKIIKFNLCVVGEPIPTESAINYSLNA